MDKKEFRNRSRPDSQSKSTRLESSSSKGGSAKGKKSLMILGKGISTVALKCRYETATTCHGTCDELLKDIEHPSKTGIVFLDRKYRDNSKDAEKREHSHWMMLAHHAKAVAKTAKDAYTVFFRDAGEHTLEKVVQGYPTKGHDILDKTLKGSSLKNTPRETKRFIETNGLYGFVGVYGPKGEAIGIRTTKGFVTFADIEKKKEEPGDRYTGDYDMLDLLNKESRVVSHGKQVVAKGTEHYFMREVNDEIGRKSDESNSDPRWHDRWCMVRHGAQALWPAFAYWEGEVMLQGLVRYSLPVMVFTHKGCIHFVETIEEMERFYDALGPRAHPPPWWLLGPYAPERQKRLEQSVDRALTRISGAEQKELEKKTQAIRKSTVALDHLNIAVKESETGKSSIKKKELKNAKEEHKKTLEEFTNLVKKIFYNPDRAEAVRKYSRKRKGKTKGD